MTIPRDTVYVAATILQAGHIGSNFQWALGQAIDNAEHFDEVYDNAMAERSARSASQPETAR